MEVGSKRRSKISRNGVVVVGGSVLDNRMRFDEFKGGNNVYSGKEETPQVENHEKISSQKTNLDVMSSGKRKTWKSDSNFEGNSVKRSPNEKKKFGLLSDGNVRRSSIQLRKMKSEMGDNKVVDESMKKNVERVFEENKVVVVDDVFEESKKDLERVFDESSDRDESSNKFDVLIEENKVVLGDVFDETKKDLERVFDEPSDRDESSNNFDVIEENKVVVDETKKDLERVFDESSDRDESSNLSCADSSVLMPQPCRILQNYINFGESETHPLIFSKSPSNLIEENKVVDETKEDLERVFDESSEGNGIKLRKVKSEANSKVENEKNCELRKVKSLCLVDGNLRSSVQSNGLKLPLKTKSSTSSKGHGEEEKTKSSTSSKGHGEEEKEKSLCLVDGNVRSSVQSYVLKLPLKTKSSTSSKVLEEKEKCEKEFEENNLRKSIQSSGLKLWLKTKSLTSSKLLEEEEKCEKEFEENKVVVVVDESKKKLEGSFDEEKLNLENEDNKRIVIVEEKKNKVNVFSSKNEKKQVAISPIIKKETPLISGQSRIHHHLPSPSRTKPVPTSDESQSNIPRQHSKLENFVDLIMWKDASKSALIFGIGTFFIISSSYTQDLNISFISVISYLGLVYLATIFLFRSLRGVNDIGESSEYVLGEEEAMWILRLILPFINEFLIKIRALFSGDPATTMKMAVLLFILARCGSSITIWKMSKLVFFGVFIIPKVCSSYSTQLTAYGTFWIRRFGDAWVSCTHKKAVVFAIFTLIWNLSSISARIWTVFMLYVGFRHYQEKMMKEGGWVGEEEIGGQRKIGRKSNLMESKKKKKSF